MSIVAGGEDSSEWFQKFGDVPGIDYPVPAGVEPRKLKGYGLKPEIHRSEAMPPSLWWDSLDDGDGSTSASPAHQRASTDLGEESGRPDHQDRAVRVSLRHDAEEFVELLPHEM
jgi:hypothetical protein